MAASDVISIDVLPGNWLARQLRGISDDTQSLLHHRKQSREGRTKPGPFFSLYEIDYGGPGSKVMVVDGIEGLVKAKKDRPLNLFSRSGDRQPSKMFQNWKVPQRLLDSEGIQRKVDQIKPVTPLPFEDKRTYHNEVIHKMEDMHVDQAQEFNAKMPTPTPTLPYHNLHDKVRVASAQSAFSSKLPDIYTCKPKSAIPGSRASVKSAAPTIVRSATALSKYEDQHKTLPKPEVKRPTFDFEKKYTKGVIDKAMRQSNKFANVDRLLSKALLPDARMAALKWLDQASDQDRHVGLEFFQSVAGTKLMGTSSDEQIMRLEQVLNTLRSGRPIGVHMLPRYQEKAPSQLDANTRLKYLRLLTPDTRKQKWQQKTWHHLPVYHDKSIVENKSSILTEPHKQVSRHFVIHPDWG